MSDDDKDKGIIETFGDVVSGAAKVVVGGTKLAAHTVAKEVGLAADAIIDEGLDKLERALSA